MNAYRVSRKNYDLYVGNTVNKSSQFYIEDAAFTMMLTGIDYTTDDVLTGIPKFAFTYVYNSSTYMPLLQGISGPGRAWILSYDEAYSINSDYKRFFLREFRESSEDSPLRYHFDYNGISAGLQKTTTTLPDSSSKQLDRWGYYNASAATSLMPEVFVNPVTTGMEKLRYEQVPSLAAYYPYSLSGNSRTVNLAALITGSLAKVSILDGGTTEIEYESNTYFDPQSGTDPYGSGIRVKKLTTYDITVPGLQKVVDYNYADPATGHTSGRALSLPVYAFIRAQPFSLNPEADWKNSIVRSDEDLSEVDDGIMYGFFKERVPGQGYITAEFTLPATHFDLTSSSDWNRIITNIAGCNGTGGTLNNDRDLYPFVPNMDISFERGMPIRQAVYNEADQKLSETLYSFSRTGNAIYIPGFKREYNSGVLAYAKYKILTGVESAIQQKQDFSFDVASGQQQHKITSYFYEGNGHQYPTKIETQSGDGKLLRVLTSYTKDYNTSLSNDSAALAIRSMVLKNINVPIEIINQVERAGNSKTVSASLTKFAIFTPGTEQPAKTLIFRNATGITDFHPSNIQSGVFVSDGRYYTTGNFTDYNAYGQLLSANDGKGNVSSSIYDYNSRLALAGIKNARHDEVLYSNFEEGNLAGLWFEANGQGSVDSHTGKQSVITNTSAVLYRDLKKKLGATTYILSAWINSNAASILNLTVSDGSGQLVSRSVNIISAPGTWKYYQVRIPVNAIGPNFRLRLWSTSSLLIDDVIFRPEEAEVGISSYDLLTQNLLATYSSNGIGARYDYDGVNRIKHVYDQDRNMVQKTSYILGANQDRFTPRIATETNQLVNQTINFSMENDAVTSGDGITFTWNFGDGSPSFTGTYESLVQHTYSVAGTYTVSLTKTAPVYGSVSVTKNLIVSQPQVIGTQLIADWDMTLTFYQNNQIVRQISPAELSSGPVSISPGIYTVRIGISGAYATSNPYGFKSIQYSTVGPNNTNLFKNCLSSSPGVNIYEFGVDLTGKEKLSISVANEECSLGPIE
ncbi:PKD domain-containing protein [Pedobacter nototheniae]|uniref:PKD domain-containing protein n=1 Tax=Pedobacter nototheniae TaxID=2488994 RepID=UPI00103947EF|nr:PKD domain-containing protein [Pedobacter nototheniae]